MFAGRQTFGTLPLQQVNLTDEIAPLANTHLLYLYRVEPAEPGSSTRSPGRADSGTGSACATGGAQSAAGVS